MKKCDVSVGSCYNVAVSGRIATVRITGESPYGGWNGINQDTGRSVRIKTAARLRGLAIRQLTPAEEAHETSAARAYRDSQS